MPREDEPLLNINAEKHTTGDRVSKSFLVILIAFGILLSASTITLGVLYFGSLETIQDIRIYKVFPGDAIILRDGFTQLANQRVGLITNPTAIVNSIHIIDWMFFTPNTVNMSLVVLFGPEHGLRGNGAAGQSVNNSVDPRTGLPIYSLYGNVYAPTPEMLKGVTALVFDIQDVGCRFFTYISTMGLCMQSAAQAGIPFFVLDRPNPLGDKVDGWVLNPDNTSFIGQYPIPLQYGLTAGELAMMIKGEQLLSGLQNLSLTVVTMEGYKRDIFWSDTDLPWISPSPNMVDLDTALLYPGTGFFEAFNLATEGRGTLLPFKMIGAPWVNTTLLLNAMNSYNLPGVSFTAAQFTPVNISDMSGVPKFLDTPCFGVEIHVTDKNALEAVELGVYLVYTFYQQAPNDTKPDLIDEQDLNLHAGTDQFWLSLNDGSRPSDIIWQWKTAVQQYESTRKPYLLY